MHLNVLKIKIYPKSKINKEKCWELKTIKKKVNLKRSYK
jgi:hypothetical protein